MFDRATKTVLRSLVHAMLLGTMAMAALGIVAWGQDEDEVKPPSAPPYQSVQNIQDFDYAVSVPGQPTVYLQDGAVQSPVQNNINLAMDALANCKKAQFDDAIKSIRFYQAGERHNYDVHLQSARAHGGRSGFELREAYWSLSDANTLASVINWLLAKQAWDKCKPPAAAPVVRTPTYSGLHPLAAPPVREPAPTAPQAHPWVVPPPRPGAPPSAPTLRRQPGPVVLSRCPNGQAYQTRASDGNVLTLPCSVTSGIAPK
jgi:hypothetical protein